MGNCTNRLRRTAIYVRAFTKDHKVDDGYEYGLEVQKTEIREYIQNNITLNFNEVVIFEDIQSNNNSNRPAYQKMIREIKDKNIDAVITLDMHCLSLSLDELLDTFKIMDENNTTHISLLDDIYIEECPLEN